MNIAQLKNLSVVWRLAGGAVLILLISLALLEIFWIQSDAARRLSDARSRQISQDDIPFTKNVREPTDTKEIQIWQSVKNVRAIARFNNAIFAATDGGLVRFSATGEIEKHFTVLDGLPESDLTCLAVFGSKLFIGTAANGLLAFDGERFENYRWTDRDAKSVVTLLSDGGGNLLVGTFAGGLIEFDGIRFREIKAADKRLKSVNFLLRDAARLFVGTFDDGLWTAEAGRWQHLTVAEGLLSNRIVGVVASGDGVLVGTDLGVAQTTARELSAAATQKVFHPLATIPALASLTFFDNQILAARDDGEIYVVSDGGKQSAVKNLVWNRPNNLATARLHIENGNLWFFSNAGIWQLREKNSFGIYLTPFAKSSNDALTQNIVSALAVDVNGKIWAGTFRRGIDVLTSEGKPLAHLENEIVREVNFLLPAGETGKLLAATAGGVISFDRSFHQQITTKADGLASNSVMHLAVSTKDQQAIGGAAFFATSRGLSFQTGSGWRALTSANGLPSDNVFTALFYQNSLFVGTLGGLAQIENGRVVRTLTDSNSKLTHNWISALCRADGRLFVGTYGGGVFELTAAGELSALASETGKFAVNPNAMYSDGGRLYVGTLDGAWILDLPTQKWRHLTDELPSATVLSVTGNSDSIYFGTTNGIARINKRFWAEKSEK